MKQEDRTSARGEFTTLLIPSSMKVNLITRRLVQDVNVIQFRVQPKGELRDLQSN
jgi:hypothetical protein